MEFLFVICILFLVFALITRLLFDRTCPYCRKAINRRALKCPYCQSDLKTGKS